MRFRSFPRPFLWVAAIEYMFYMALSTPTSLAVSCRDRPLRRQGRRWACDGDHWLDNQLLDCRSPPTNARSSCSAPGRINKTDGPGQGGRAGQHKNRGECEKAFHQTCSRNQRGCCFRRAPLYTTLPSETMRTRERSAAGRKDRRRNKCRIFAVQIRSTKSEIRNKFKTRMSKIPKSMGI